MDEIWQRASLIFEKNPNELELCIIKPDILNIIQDLEKSVTTETKMGIV